MGNRLPCALSFLTATCLIGSQIVCGHKPGAATGTAAPEAAAPTPQDQPKAPDAKPAATAAAQPAATPANAPPTAAPPAAAAAPKTATLTVPAKTRLSVALAHDLATDKQKPGDTWQGTLVHEVTVGGQVAWPKGTPVKGVVTQSDPAGRLKGGQGGLGIRLSAVGGNDVAADTYLVAGDKRGGRDAKFIGGTAALGALVGILTSRGHQADHALGGAAIGAAAGTGAAAATADTVIRIPATKVVAFTLERPEKVVLR